MILYIGKQTRFTTYGQTAADTLILALWVVFNSTSFEVGAVLCVNLGKHCIKPKSLSSVLDSWQIPLEGLRKLRQFASYASFLKRPVPCSKYGPFACVGEDAVAYGAVCGGLVVVFYGFPNLPEK